MNEYSEYYAQQFNRNLQRYAGMRQQIQRRVDRILADPYFNTEELSDSPSGLNLLGCRSARIDRSFRLIFVICEECIHIPECNYCLCEGLDDRTVVFLTVGPYEQAYAMR